PRSERSPIRITRSAPWSASECSRASSRPTAVTCPAPNWCLASCTASAPVTPVAPSTSTDAPGCTPGACARENHAAPAAVARAGGRPRIRHTVGPCGTHLRPHRQVLGHRPGRWRGTGVDPPPVRQLHHGIQPHLSRPLQLSAAVVAAGHEHPLDVLDRRRPHLRHLTTLGSHRLDHVPVLRHATQPLDHCRLHHLVLSTQLSFPWKPYARAAVLTRWFR